MPKWRSSAAYRIAFLNFGAYAAGLILLGAVMYVDIHLAFSRQLDSMIADEARELQDDFAVGGNPELSEEIADREAAKSRTHMLYAVFGPDGRRIYGSLQVSRPELGIHPIIFQDPKEGPDKGRAIAVDLSPNERLIVAVDSDWLERIQRFVILIFGAALVGMLAVSFGGALVLGAYLQRRLQSISTSAEAIIGGDIHRRMPIGSRQDEFDDLAQTLNRMLDRIEELLENLRQVSSDIAHDLRTPLARLRNRLELGASGEKDVENLINDAIAQLDDVLSLFGAILRVAEVESGEPKRLFVSVDLSAMLNELAESYAKAFEDEGRKFLWFVEPDMTVQGDRDLLAQAVINLLENAKRHTTADATIRMAASSGGSTASVRIIDDGPGVPPADLGRITKRFARLESSRKTAGHGLGLSLVSAVAKLHGGRLILENCDPGLAATIEIVKTHRRKAARRTRVDHAGT